jgi:hypothetical protein
MGVICTRNDFFLKFSQITEAGENTIDDSSDMIGMKHNRITYLIPRSDYLNWLKGEISMTNSEDSFSDEIVKLSKERTRSLVKVSSKNVIENPRVHKYFFHEKELL